MMCSGGIHIPYMVCEENLNLAPLIPKIWQFALRPMETLKSHNSGTVKNACKMFAQNMEFSGSGNNTDPPLLPW